MCEYQLFHTETWATIDFSICRITEPTAHGHGGTTVYAKTWHNRTKCLGLSLMCQNWIDSSCFKNEEIFGGFVCCWCWFQKINPKLNQTWLIKAGRTSKHNLYGIGVIVYACILGLKDHREAISNRNQLNRAEVLVRMPLLIPMNALSLCIIKRK